MIKINLPKLQNLNFFTLLYFSFSKLQKQGNYGVVFNVTKRNIKTLQYRETLRLSKLLSIFMSQEICCAL